MARPFFFGGNQSQQQSQYLVQMKAGKMVKNGNMVSPIKDRKGLVYLHQNAEDNLMHFCWKDRTTGQLEDDLIMFPDDAEFLKVQQCTTGRVFVLKFKTSSRRLFFWSQEPKDDKDDEIVKKINEYINDPSAATRQSNTGSNNNNNNNNNNLISTNDLNLGSDEEFRNLFSNANLSAQQLMSMLEGGLAQGGASRLASLLVQNAAASNNSSSSRNSQSSTPNTTPANNNSDNSSSTTATGLQLSDLQNIISGLSSTTSPSTGSSTTTANDQSDQNELNVDLSTSINVDVLRSLLQNENFMKSINDMLPQTSSGSESESTKLSEQFISTIGSPQFQQALNSFSHAIQSGQLGPLIQQFGLPESCVAAANKGNFEAFVKALQQNNKDNKDEKKKAEDSKKDKDNDDDDDSMALD